MVWWLRLQVAGGAAVRGTIFYKMTGSGNDFVMLDGRATDARPLAGRTRVGADLRSPRRGRGRRPGDPHARPPGAVRMSYWNSDGSRAAMCGNAALCSGRLAVYLEMVPAGEFCLLTDAGVVRVELRRHRAMRPRSTCPTASSASALHGLAAGAGRALAGLRDGGGAASGGPGGRHRGGGCGGSGAGTALRPSAGAGRAPTSTSWPRQSARRALADPNLRAGRRRRNPGLRDRDRGGGAGPGQRGEAGLPLRFRSRGGPELAVRAELNGGRATDVWLGGQGRLVFRGVWEGV